MSRFKKRLIFFLVCLLFDQSQIFGQEVDLSNVPKKGSYLYYGQPAFEDNSLLLEEAFTQEKRVLQHILNVQWDHLRHNDILFSFSQEIPLSHLTHQFSYTINYSYFAPVANATSPRIGLGDIFLSYYRMITGERSWIMIVPRLSVIVPTGKSKGGFGSGGWGAQCNVALSKRIESPVQALPALWEHECLPEVSAHETLSFQKPGGGYYHRYIQLLFYLVPGEIFEKQSLAEQCQYTGKQYGYRVVQFGGGLVAVQRKII